MALFSQVSPAPAQTAGQDRASSSEEAARRLQWLKAVGPDEAASTTATPSPGRKHFAETRNLGVRLTDSPSAETSASETPKNGAAPTPAASSPAPKIAGTHSASTSTPSGKSREKTHHEENVASAKHHGASHATETPSEKSKASAGHSESVAESHSATSPVPKPSSTPPHSESVAGAKHSSADLRITDTHPAATSAPKQNSSSRHSEVVVPMSKRGDLEMAEARSAETSAAVLAPAHGSTRAGRYPWKTGIVTTVFWIGEPVGGHNFTPNCSSSWDAHWTQSYGGFDNPNPEARRNFLPANFIPRQNPFYVALPYNDVTRGTTKPEARVVIPWFREAFRKEGQSVCRDRWVEIRGRSGRVAYAQWSDCGPFRTDHYQYVFGIDRPKPNLNGGAGLDVSPAVRDYLGLQPTDVTDWKFVDTHEVPNGPWLLYGDNNPFAQRHSRGSGLDEVVANRR